VVTWTEAPALCGSCRMALSWYALMAKRFSSFILMQRDLMPTDRSPALIVEQGAGVHHVK